MPKNRLHEVLLAGPDGRQISFSSLLKRLVVVFLFSRKRFPQPQGNCLPKLLLKADLAHIKNSKNINNRLKLLYIIFIKRRLE